MPFQWCHAKVTYLFLLPKFARAKVSDFRKFLMWPLGWIISWFHTKKRWYKFSKTQNLGMTWPFFKSVLSISNKKAWYKRNRPFKTDRWRQTKITVASSTNKIDFKKFGFWLCYFAILLLLMTSSGRDLSRFRNETQPKAHPKRLSFRPWVVLSSIIFGSCVISSTKWQS